MNEPKPKGACERDKEALLQPHLSLFGMRCGSERELRKHETRQDGRNILISPLQATTCTFRESRILIMSS